MVVACGEMKKYTGLQFGVRNTFSEPQIGISAVGWSSNRGYTLAYFPLSEPQNYFLRLKIYPAKFMTTRIDFRLKRSNLIQGLRKLLIIHCQWNLIKGQSLASNKSSKNVSLRSGEVSYKSCVSPPLNTINFFRF